MNLVAVGLADVYTTPRFPLNVIEDVIEADTCSLRGRRDREGDGKGREGRVRVNGGR